jgi:uncharacterized membrane protein
MLLQLIQNVFFRDKRQFNLFFVLLLSTLFDFTLVAYRLYHTDYDLSQLASYDKMKEQRGTYATFFFLIWNLFLAWIPYWIALTVDFYERHSERKSKWTLGILVGLWLLFFPNAPYILTDLLHLRNYHVVPHWYDLMLIVSFAWTGLLLGYCSLFEIQRFLESRFKKWFAWFLTVSAIWLGGFGVYMGRFQRWNSWDIVTHPLSIFKQQVHILLNPTQYLATLGVAFVLSGFMLLGYLTLNALRTS